MPAPDTFGLCKRVALLCPRPGYPRELIDYLRAHGRKKVLFGSNQPAWPAPMCLEGFESLDLDAEAEELFLYRNAERVLGLGMG